MRLQVYLSHNGVCSRRNALDMIKEGRVKVNGRIVREPSREIDEVKHEVRVDGDIIESKKYSYIMLNKPTGFTTTKSDPNAKKTIYDLIAPAYQHCAPVGRLDRDTEGLLLLTNDGELTYQLTHPKFKCDKIYFVTINEGMDMKSQRKLESGVWLDGKKTAAAKITGYRLLKRGATFRITIHEGRKRQVRRMFAKIGKKVVFLKRIQQGPLKLGSLKTGISRLLSTDEIKSLKKEKR